MYKRTIGLTLCLVACGSDVGDTAAQLISDAGELLEDAGQALADAGQVLADAGQGLVDGGKADAQVGPQDSGQAQSPGPSVLAVACDIERTYTATASGQQVTQRFARYDGGVEHLRSAWLCTAPARPIFDCSGGTTCSEQPPRQRCSATLPLLGDDGSVWVQCGAENTAEFVVD